MKRCSYCGRENSDDVLYCRECGTEFESPAEPAPPKPMRPEYTFAPLTEAERQQDVVTLVACGTLMAADTVVSRLRAEGIEAFIPDEGLMQAVGWNFNTYGYVRVQVAPKDYDAARELLAGGDKEAGSL